MVPKDWQHPKGERGFVELHARSILQYEDANTPDDERIQADDLMPEFGESATHMMMYETCTAGTPISPACETAEELAKWLADNGASAFGRQTATYDQWRAMIGVGNAPSLVVDNGGIRSGVEATATYCPRTVADGRAD